MARCPQPTQRLSPQAPDTSTMHSELHHKDMPRCQVMRLTHALHAASSAPPAQPVHPSPPPPQCSGQTALAASSCAPPPARQAGPPVGAAGNIKVWAHLHCNSAAHASLQLKFLPPTRVSSTDSWLRHLLPPSRPTHHAPTLYPSTPCHPPIWLSTNSLEPHHLRPPNKTQRLCGCSLDPPIC